MRTSRGPQHRTAGYLGEPNGSTESAWRKSVAVFNGEGTETQLELFASDSPVVPSGERVVQVVLEALRRAGGLFLVGTSRTPVRKVGARLLEENWTKVREGIEVKKVASPDGSEDTFILRRSTDRRKKEAAIHDRFEQRMDERLGRLQTAVHSGRLRSRDVLQQRLDRLKLECSRVARAYRFDVEGDGDALSFSWTKDEAKAQYLRHIEGAYLLRTRLAGHEEPELGKMHMQLDDAEATFRTLKQEFSIRPVHHQTEHRVKAHVIVCILAYSMYRTLDRLAKMKGLDMTARRVL